MSNKQSNKAQMLQDPFLDALCRDRTPITMFLVNGIRLTGQIQSFDQYAIVLKSATAQMIFKHAISTIVPTTGVGKDIDMPIAGRARHDEERMSPPDIQKRATPVIIKRAKPRLIVPE